ACNVGGLPRKERLIMCDYSLHNVKSRPAKVGDKLTTRNFGLGTRGFSAPEDATTAVCVLPGTEIAFSQEPVCAASGFLGWGAKRSAQKRAISRRVTKARPGMLHDALDFPGGRMALLTGLLGGQEAPVPQLRAQPPPAGERKERGGVAYIG